MPKKWTKKYKRSIDCNNPKGFSQKAHCAGRKKRESKMSLKLEELVGKKLTEEQFDEAAGKKDACYHKVKARYDVWPSAYASGALVKCRKVGAKNWGNKSKKESIVKEFGLPPTMQAQKKELKNPKTGKMVTVGSIMNQGTKTYPSALVKKAKAIYSAALERERATKKKLYGKSKYSFSGKKEGLGDKISKISKKYAKSQKKSKKALKNKKGPYQENVFFESTTKDGMTETHIYWESNGKPNGYTFRFVNELNEAEYQGRKVKLNKIMQGDKKKFKVYVKNPKGNVVKVNFGQGGDAKGGTMRIRKSNPEARKSFRARHNCDNPGPKHKARYWSCRKW